MVFKTPEEVDAIRHEVTEFEWNSHYRFIKEVLEGIRNRPKKLKKRRNNSRR